MTQQSKPGTGTDPTANTTTGCAGEPAPASRSTPRRSAGAPARGPLKSSDAPAVPASPVSGTAAPSPSPPPAAADPPTAPPEPYPHAEPRPLGERRVWPRSFADRLTTPLPGFKAFARFAREGAVRPGPEGLADIPRLPYDPQPLPRVDARSVAVSWAGHASWVIRIGGLTVLTDPVWSRRILGTPARITPVGVAWSTLRRVDAVVISHNHYDHLDAPTLRRLPRDTAVFVPAGLGGWFRRRRFTRVTELDWWEAAELGPGSGAEAAPAEGGGREAGIRFDFVPAHHWSKRTLTDTCRSLWGGWVLTDPAAGHRVHFAGDTGYGHWFSWIGRRYPGIDLTLLPIGAYEPRWWLGDVHCDPEDAVRAFQDLGAHRMAPMHWGTFVLSAEPVLEPLTRIRAAWERAGLPRENLWDLPVGGSRVLETSPSTASTSPSRSPATVRRCWSGPGG